jgi:hypothetical protein
MALGLALPGCTSSADLAETTAAVSEATDPAECDADGDGFEARECGGEDCDDTNPELTPLDGCYPVGCMVRPCGSIFNP